MIDELLRQLKRRLRDATHDNDMKEWDKISKRIDAIEAGQPDPGDDEMNLGCEGTE